MRVFIFQRFTMNLFLHKKKAARPRREGRNINDVVKVTLSITTPFYLW